MALRMARRGDYEVRLNARVGLPLPARGLVAAFGNQSSFAGQLFIRQSLRSHQHDPQGQMLYVIIVVALWGLSIVLLIGSYVRKNRVDASIMLYLKEMQVVRKRSDTEKVLHLVSSSPPPPQSPAIFTSPPRQHHHLRRKTNSVSYTLPPPTLPEIEVIVEGGSTGSVAV